MATATKTTTGTCYKCGGSGYIQAFSNIAGGVCFTCAGSGQVKFTDRPAPTAAIIPHDGELEERRVKAILFADMTGWTFRQLHAARMFAVARMDTTPGVWDAWLEHGEDVFKARLRD